MIKQNGYINGQFIDSKNRITIKSPIDFREVGSIPHTDIKTMGKAIESAKIAQLSWKKLTRDQRINYVENFLAMLKSSEQLLLKLLVLEIGKSKKEAKKEMKAAYRYVEDTIHSYFNIYIKTVDPSDIRNEKKSVSIVIEPLGVVLAMTPFFSPVKIALSKIIPAIISGNSVIFKPEIEGSIIAGELMKLFNSCNFPPGVINLVVCDWKSETDFLIKNEHIDKITFSGPRKIGRKIAEVSSMKKLTLELGGNPAAVVFPKSHPSTVASEIIEGAFTYSGQSDVAIKRLIVHEDIYDDIINALKRQILNLKIGSPETNSFIVPLINKEAAKRQLELTDEAVEQGAKILVGGVIEDNLAQATVLIDCKKEMRISTEDQFGPTLPVFEFKETQEAIDLVNSTEYGLQVSIYNPNTNDATEMGLQLDVGTININGIPGREPDASPFIGAKTSGLGTQGIMYAIKSVTRPKPYVFNKIEKIY